MKTEYINNFQRDLELWGTYESPEDKAKRLGVPLLPAKKELPKKPDNPIIAICGQCGAEWRQIMWYSCQNSNCPMQNKPML